VVITSPTQSTAPPQDSSPRPEALEIEDSQPIQQPAPPSEGLAVQVSQHSSFDRDQYVQFLASGSTQDLSSSQQQHPDSGLGSSSPTQETFAQRVIDYEEVVVPDSQSLAEPLKYTSTSSRSIEHSHANLSFDSQPPTEEVINIATATTPLTQNPQPAYYYNQDSPLFCPCPEEAFDSSRAKEADNQVVDLVTGSPGLPDPQIAHQDHRSSPSFSPCAEAPFENSRAKEGDIQAEDLVTESPGVSDLQTACDYHRSSPLVGEPFDTSGAKESDNLVGGGLHRLPGSPSVSSIFDARKDIPLTSIEFDKHELSSSPIPPAPSQLLETFVTQAPGPPSSLFTDNDTMAERAQPVTGEHIVPSSASSQSSGARIPLLERIKEMRARSAARSKAEKEARFATYDPRVVALLTKRTNNIPNPITRASQENRNFKLVGPSSTSPVADDAAELSSQQSKHDLQDDMSQQSSSSSSFGHPLLGKMEYAIPLPLNPNIVEQYKQTLYNSRQDIESFVQHEVAEDSRMIDDMRAMIVRLIKLTIHSDLDTLTVMTQEQISETDQAQWAKTCSGKFEFLGAFITAARARDIHVVIIASHDKLLDILETFLKAYHAAYVRPDVMRRSDSAAEGPLRFTLLATTDSSSIVSTAALVMAFDESVNTQEPRVTALRAHMLEVGKLSPLIHLLVVNSAEHIEKCLPSSLTGVQRLQALVSCAAQTRHKVGQLPPDMPGPRVAAEEVAASLSLGGRDDQLKLPLMPKLVDVDLLESSSQADSTRSATQQSPVPDIAPTSNCKRAMVCWPY
jgi:hypothetical protein